MSELANAIADLKEDEVKKIVQGKITSGANPMAMIDECPKGMEIVGERYKNKEYFLGELIMSGEIFKEAMAAIEPKLKAGQSGKPIAKMVIGTAKGDIHNIGKDIVAPLLKAAGFEIYDVGIDSATEVFVNKLKETDAEGCSQGQDATHSRHHGLLRRQVPLFRGGRGQPDARNQFQPSL